MGTLAPGMAQPDLRKSFMTRGVICCTLDKPFFRKGTSSGLAGWLCGNLGSEMLPSVCEQASRCRLCGGAEEDRKKDPAGAAGTR